MTRGLLFQIGNFLFFMIVQILFLRNVVLFDYSFAFLYIGFLLMLPFEIGAISLMGLAFLTGFITDVFYDSLGMHTAATVFIAFLRPYWVQTLTPRGGYEQGALPNIRSLGFRWFMSYALTLIFIHHLALFIIEKGNFSLFFITLIKAISSSIFTFILLVLFQYLVKPRERV